MVYVVPDSKKSIKQNVFEFSIAGKTHSVGRFDELPTTFLEDLAEIDEKRVLNALRLAIAGTDEKLAAMSCASRSQPASFGLRAADTADLSGGICVMITFRSRHDKRSVPRSRSLSPSVKRSYSTASEWSAISCRRLRIPPA